jgi:hypothetical protein
MTGRSGDRNPVEETFSALVQIDPGAKSEVLQNFVPNDYLCDRNWKKRNRHAVRRHQNWIGEVREISRYATARKQEKTHFHRRSELDTRDVWKAHPSLHVHVRLPPLPTPRVHIIHSKTPQFIFSVSFVLPFAIKNIKIRIHKTLILPVVLYGYETWSHIEGGMQAKGFRE